MIKLLDTVAHLFMEWALMWMRVARFFMKIAVEYERKHPK